MKKILIIPFVLATWISCGKKETPITNESLRQVLTDYGRENPENQVAIETKFGTMKIKLYDDTPLHRANFIKLIKEGHYDKAMFYRIVYEFMIQGGDAANQLKYRIPAEFNPKHFHKKGALSMARMDVNNPKMESSAAEFFIIQGSRYDPEEVDQEASDLGLTLTSEQRQIYISQGGYMSLDQKYTVFGEVTEGLDVIDKIASEKVINEDRPVQKIPMRISVVELDR